MYPEEDTEFKEFITFIEKIQSVLNIQISKREEGWNAFLLLVDEAEHSSTIWQSPEFQNRIRSICKNIDCRLLEEEKWEKAEEIELLAQVSLRTLPEQDDIEDDEAVEEGEEFNGKKDFSLDPGLFDIPLEDFNIIAPKDVLGFFVLLDRYIEFYESFLKRAEYSLLYAQLPENKDGTEMLSELRDSL